MIRILFTLFFLQSSCLVLRGQLLVTPSLQDDMVLVNPAMVGVLQKEKISMSTYSTREKELIFDPRPTFKSNISSVYELRNINFIGYHRTQILPNNYKVTIGLHAQTAKGIGLLYTNPNTFGFTTNLHIPLVGNSYKERYFSVGLQMNIIHQKPNSTVTEFVYNHIVGDPAMTYLSFHKQFSKFGFQSVFSLGLLSRRKKKSITAFGLSLAAIESKESSSIFNTTSLSNGSVSFSSNVSYLFQAYFNMQLAVGRKSSLEAAILGSNQMLASSLNFGFRLKKKLIMRIGGQFTLHDLQLEQSGLSLSIDHKNYSYNVYFGSYRYSQMLSDLSSFFPEITGNHARFGVTYHFSDGLEPSLLRTRY